MMKHIVLGTNVIIKQKAAETVSCGGIVLPENTQTKPLRGVVVKIGNVLTSQKLQEGQDVLFDRFAGVPVTLDNEQYLVMDQNDILIILQD